MQPDDTQTSNERQQATTLPDADSGDVAKPTLAQEARHIREVFDFRPYLEAVNTSSQRTRSVIYLVFAILIATICPLRNTVFPDAMDKRLARMLQAAACWQQGESSTSCKRVETYVRHLGLALTGIGKRMPTSVDPIVTNAYNKQIELLLQKRTDEHTVQIPFVSLTVDINDLWLLSGLPMIVVLVIFRACLLRESDNIEKAKAAALADADPSRDRDLVIMAQVLRFSTMFPKDPPTIWRFVVWAVFALPTLVHGLVVFVDLSQLPYNTELGFWYRLIAPVEVLIGFLIAALSVSAYRIWNDADDTFLTGWDRGRPEPETFALDSGHILVKTPAVDGLPSPDARGAG